MRTMLPHPLPSPAPQALSGVCERVSVDVAKSVLKQGAVQHLYGKLSAQVHAGEATCRAAAAEGT